MEILLTVKELAAALKLTEQTIQRYVLRKEIPYRKIMRAVRFRPSEVNRWIDNGGLITDGETDGVLHEETEAVRLEIQEMGDEAWPPLLEIFFENPEICAKVPFNSEPDTPILAIRDGKKYFAVLKPEGRRVEVDRYWKGCWESEGEDSSVWKRGTACRELFHSRSFFENPEIGTKVPFNSEPGAPIFVVRDDEKPFCTS